MKFEILGKNGFELTDAISNYATEKLEKLSKYFSDTTDINVRVVCKVYDKAQKIEVTMPVKHLILRTETSDSDMYVSIDKAVKKIEVQIKKHKDKINKAIQNREGISNFFSEEVSMEDLNAEIQAKNLVKTKNIELEKMNRREALERMDQLGHDFYVYLDEETMGVNVVYLREDMDYAVIETKID